MNLRLQRLQKKLIDQKLDSFLVTHPLNVRYLSAFWGKTTLEREAFILVLPRKAYLITSALYFFPAPKKMKDLTVVQVTYQQGVVESLRQLLTKNKARKLGFESHNLTVAEKENLQKQLKVRLVPTQDFIEDLRVIKEEREIRKISTACQIADKAMKYAVSRLRPGLSEKEIAKKIRMFIYQISGEVPCEPVVAAGKNSSLPHHTPSDKKLEQQEVVLIDLMSKKNGYQADLTRVFFLGEPTSTEKKLYELVLSTQKLCLEKIKKGIKACHVDKIARDQFKKEKLAKNFVHALGHGVGLAEHERPFLSPNSFEVLKENMVFTIEPGIYLPGWGGIRIEDTAVLENGEVQALTKFPKEITVV